MRALMVLCLTLAACAGSGPRASAPTSEETVRVTGGSGGTVQLATTATTRPRMSTVDMPVAGVWRALPAAYAAVGIQIAHSDSAAKVTGNPGFRARRVLAGTRLSRYLDCGRAQGNPSADTYEVHFSVLTQLHEEADARTVVITTVDATARPVNFPGESVRCLSLGELENRIAAALREPTE